MPRRDKNEGNAGNEVDAVELDFAQYSHVLDSFADHISLAPTTLLYFADAHAAFMAKHQVNLLNLSYYEANPSSTPIPRGGTSSWADVLMPHNEGTQYTFDAPHLTLYPPITAQEEEIAEDQSYGFMKLIPKRNGQMGALIAFSDGFYLSDRLKEEGEKAAERKMVAWAEHASESTVTFKQKFEDDEGEVQTGPKLSPTALLVVFSVRAYMLAVLRFFRNRAPKHSLLYSPIYLWRPADPRIQDVEQVFSGVPLYLHQIMGAAFRCVEQMLPNATFPDDEIINIACEVISMTRNGEDSRRKKVPPAPKPRRDDLDDRIAAAVADQPVAETPLIVIPVKQEESARKRMGSGTDGTPAKRPVPNIARDSGASSSSTAADNVELPSGSSWDPFQLTAEDFANLGGRRFTLPLTRCDTLESCTDEDLMRADDILCSSSDAK